MPPDNEECPPASRAGTQIIATDQSAEINPQSTPTPAAWCSNLTEPGRLLPERWRVGKFERSTLLKSAHATIVDDVAHTAAAMVAEGEDPMAAGCQAGALWRELVDDACCLAMVRVLDEAEIAA